MVDNHSLVYEEVKAVRIFLWLFYIIYFGYDFFYFFLFPKDINGQDSLLEEGLGFWMYILLLAILPIAIYLVKKGNPHLIKYLYFLSYCLLDAINILVTYLGKDKEFLSGNFVEILFLLFSPIFINKRYFWVVSIGMIVKYLFYGVVLQTLNVVVPIVIVIILSGVIMILLNRFLSYVNAVKKATEALYQKEKLAMVGQMATTIGHEIRNPLSSLRGFTQLQKEQFGDENGYFSFMLKEIDRIKSILDDLLLLGKPKPMQWKQQNMGEMIDHVLSICTEQANANQVKIIKEYQEHLPNVVCNENSLIQVLINLIKNAIESMDSGGSVYITTKRKDDRYILISVKDEGCGIDEKNLIKLKEPFYTTKDGGTGLGLMVTFKIVEEHGGNIYINSQLGKGTLIEVLLPIHPSI